MILELATKVLITKVKQTELMGRACAWNLLLTAN